MVGGIILILIGILFCFMGILVWKKQKISLFHDYHIDKITEEDIPGFCQMAGIGVLIVGIGILLTGILVIIFSRPIVFLLLGIGMVVGVAMLVRAENKYNK